MKKIFLVLFFIASAILNAEEASNKEVTLYEAEKLVKKGEAKFINSSQIESAQEDPNIPNIPTVEKMPPKTNMATRAEHSNTKTIENLTPRPKINGSAEATTIAPSSPPPSIPTTTLTFIEPPERAETSLSPKENIIFLLEANKQNIDKIADTLESVPSSTLNKKRIMGELKRIQAIHDEQLKALKNL